MKIYTGGGDQGETSLPDGSRSPKHSLRVRGYGSLDELASFLGWLASQEELTSPPHPARLKGLVAWAMEAGACVSHGSGPPPRGLPGSVEDLEAWMDEMDRDLPPLGTFLLPMGSPGASVCHVVRSQCRRIERELVALRAGAPFPGWVLAWVNRLADFLFVLARRLNQVSGKGDIPWKRGEPGESP